MAAINRGFVTLAFMFLRPPIFYTRQQTEFITPSQKNFITKFLEVIPLDEYRRDAMAAVGDGDQADPFEARERLMNTATALQTSSMAREISHTQNHPMLNTSVNARAVQIPLITGS